MYHISNDVRAKQSAASIVRGLVIIAQNESLSDTSVSDIVRESKVCRSTFYRLFDNVIDVLVYACDCITEEILISAGNLEALNTQDVFLFLINSIMNHDHLLETLINAQRMDLFCMSFRNNLSVINHRLIKNHPIDEGSADYLNNIISVIIAVLVTTWIQHGKGESKHQIYKRLQSCFRMLNDLL